MTGSTDKENTENKFPEKTENPLNNTSSVANTESSKDASIHDSDKPKKQQKKKKKTTPQLMLSLLIKLLAITVSIWLLLTFILCLSIHYGNNMYPALKDGDLIISLRLQKPYLNDAVQYEHDGKLCLGRVIGMAGNVIDISDEGALTVNGVSPAEEVFYPTYRCETADITYPYTVGENQVFILNDFRSDTNDSRSFGAVDIKNIKGSILLLFRRRGF